MIIPKLVDDTYEIIIGFAKNTFAEQRFSLAVNKKDKGFQLKNFGEKGWGLINLQTTAVIMNSGTIQKTTTEFTGIKKPTLLLNYSLML